MTEILPHLIHTTVHPVNDAGREARDMPSISTTLMREGGDKSWVLGETRAIDGAE
jgi:hypothetical protein